MISVGDELTNRPEEAGVKKFDSHGLMISTLINELGGLPLSLGIAPDDVNVIKKMLRNGLKKSDIVVTIGGCSVGEKDYVWEAVKLLMPTMTIRGIKVHPGRVTSLGLVDNKPIVMLPGHVQSTLVGFYVLLLPLIQLINALPPTTTYPLLKAKIDREIVLKEFASFKKVRFVKITKADSDYIARPILGDSALTSVIVKANGFIIVPEKKTIVGKGEEVKVNLLPGLFSLKQVFNTS
jgi:molybdenum cofactor synthesis domain-containing protein